MTRIIACSNLKGGEGKTTIARHLAHFAEEAGLKTLAIDLDPQLNLTESLKPEAFAGQATSSAELFTDDFSHERTRVIPVLDNLFLLPATPELEAIADLGEQSAAIRKARESIRVLANDYDVVIIDTPTNAKACYMAGWAAAHFTVSPMQLDTYGMTGAARFLSHTKTVRAKYNPGLKHIGFVINRFNSRAKAHNEMHAAVREQVQVMDSVLRERVAVQDALNRREPVWRGPRGSVNRTAAKEFRGMCKEVFQRAGVSFEPAVA